MFTINQLEPKVQPAISPHRFLHDGADLDVWLTEVPVWELAKLPDGPVQL